MADGGSDLKSSACFEDFEQVIPLTGFSGAAIALVRNPGSTQFVRKASTDPATNETLRVHADRQRKLREQLAGVAKVPEVYDEGYRNGLYYFDMEFAPSRDANAFLSVAAFDEVKGFADHVERLMHYMAASDAGPGNVSPPPALLLKVQEIDRRTAGVYTESMAVLTDLFDRLGDFPISRDTAVSHGDLTFENILVSANGQVWLIDPISSPANHHWFDWSKLFQECEGRWHLHRSKHLSTGVTHWLREYWFARATEMTPAYGHWHYPLLALTFARILPYTRSITDIDFVKKRVDLFCERAQLFI